MALREIEDRKHLKVFKSNKQKCSNSERNVNCVYQRKQNIKQKVSKVLKMIPPGTFHINYSCP